MSKQIPIKRFDKSLPLPKHQTKGAAGFDLAVRETTVVKPGQIALVPLNIAMAIPKGYFVLQAPRSSTHKLGIMAANSVGIIDCDYAGNEDEWRFLAYNFTKKPVKLEKGTRVAQGILVKYDQAAWKETPRLKAKSRGGLGSTGHK